MGSDITGAAGHEDLTNAHSFNSQRPSSNSQATSNAQRPLNAEPPLPINSQARTANGDHHWELGIGSGLAIGSWPLGVNAHLAVHWVERRVSPRHQLIRAPS